MTTVYSSTVGSTQRGSLWMLLVLAGLVISPLLTGQGTVAAVTINQGSQAVVKVQVRTSSFIGVLATSQGFAVATSPQAGPADSTITPSPANAANNRVRAKAFAAGDNFYAILFESSQTGTSIPAGTLTASWTVNGVEQTATLPVTAKAVAAGNKGGFTLLLAGDATYKPANIRVTFK